MNWYQKSMPLLLSGEELSEELVKECLAGIFNDQSDEIQIASFITAWRMKGETANEIVAALRFLRKAMIPLNLPAPLGERLLDTCGTGGDGMDTFNISTATALVVAAAGVPVVKHGNRSVSSRSGSADVCLALGIPIELRDFQALECLQTTGFLFCFAPNYHPILAKIAQLRRRLAIRTLFNYLGPLLNPANAPFQLIGIGSASHLAILSQALFQLGGQRAALVHGQDGLDEVTLAAPTDLYLISGQTSLPSARLKEKGEPKMEKMTLVPEDFGISSQPITMLQVSNAQESAARIEAVFLNKNDQKIQISRDIICMNSAVALWICQAVPNLSSGMQMAHETIVTGKAYSVLEKLRSLPK